MRKSIFIICAYLTACTVGPDYKVNHIYTDEAIKAELNLDLQQVNQKKWYDFFNDEQLKTLIVKGLEKNTDIQVALSRLHQARIVMSNNKTDYLPQVNFTGEYQYEKVSKNMGPAANTHYFLMGFDAAWEMDIWGKGRRQTEADNAEVEMTKYSLENIKLIITAEIIVNYVKMAQNIEKLKLADKNIRLRKKIYDIMATKYKNGLVNETDYNQSKYLLAEAEMQRPEFLGQAEQYRNALAVLLDVLPSQLLIKNDEIRIFCAKVRFNDDFMYNLPADIIRQRPDVALAEHQLIQQNALIGKAVADLYPAVNLSALWGYATQSSNKIFNSSSQTYNYVPTSVLSLLDWHKLQNNVKLQKLKREEAFLNYKNVVTQAVSELRNIMTAYQNSLKINRQQALSVEAMQKTAELKFKQYENGLTDFSDVLQAQQNHIAAENNYIDGKSNIYRNIAAYYKAIGKFYQ